MAPTTKPSLASRQKEDRIFFSLFSFAVVVALFGIACADENDHTRIDKNTVVVTENHKPFPDFWNNTKTVGVYSKVK